ncbi:MAG TPA: 50S ribosomal protein L24 [Verrucomicrobiae bacterium]|nr:50S ribosomal protein L24 [Verrucomicrobiae bacterium]
MAAPKQKIHVRKGDIVMVISGKDAGTKGKVLEVIPKTGRVVVEKVNVVKKHMRPTQKLPQGGIQEKEAPIASSNVMLYCEKCNSATRIGHKEMDGNFVRVCKHCGEVQDK